jgi:adenylate kinase family enzyme
MRVAVIGSSGSGKTTLARALGAAIGAPVIELDAINWQPRWRALNSQDPEEFKRRVAAAVAADRWVCDGNYRRAQPLVLARATDVVWLDYPRHLVMRRVIGRSIARSLSGQELWPGTGNTERWTMWGDPEHPIRWAWSTFHERRARFEAIFAAPEHAGLNLIRLRHPAEVRQVAARLVGERA